MTRNVGRLLGVVVSLALAVGILAGCGEDGPPSIDYVVDARVVTYNANTVAGNAAGALMTTTRVLPGFSYLGAAGQVTPDRDVGTVTPVAGNTLTLRYEFAPKAVFSDGKPLDCDDLVLAWAAMSGRVAGGFTPATRAGYRDIEKVDCSAGQKTATVTFARGRNYLDWLSLFGAGTLLPAQVIARQAGVADVLDAIRSGDRSALTAIAKAWNSGFDITPGPIDPASFPSSGPFRFDSYTVADGLVLVPNDTWWGDAPQASRIVIHGRDADTSRLTEGRFDIVDVAAGIVDGELTPGGSGAASESTTTPVQEGAPERALGVTQLVLAQSGVFADTRVRQAFASCVPRDQLVRDFGDGARMWNLRSLAPADQLSGAVNNEFANRYARADVGRSRDLLSEAAAEGVEGIGDTEGRRATVRIGYLAPSARDKQMIAAITESCARAGLTVTDASTADLSPSALGKTVDVMLTNGGAGFAATGAANAARDMFALHGQDPLDIGRFRVPAVTGAIDEYVVTPGATDRLRLVRVVENGAWNGMASIPLFAASRVQRASSQIGNVVPGAARNGTAWNMDRWTVR